MERTRTSKAAKTFLRWLVLPIVAISAVPSGAVENAPPLPNVILISIDTTRFDYLTFRDDQTAPYLTKLARDGTIFTQAISGASWTLPAHAEMFTGMPPPYHGSEIDRVELDPALPLLAERLRAHGYSTLGVYSNSYLWGNYGFDRGFDFYHSAMLAENVRSPEEREAPRGTAAAERLRQLNERGLVSAPTVVAIARRALERSAPDAPVFLFAHFMDPHSDFIPPPPFDRKFDPFYRGAIHGRGYMANPAIVDWTKRPIRRIGDRDLDHIKSLYRGEIAATDAAIGELLAVLDQYGRLDHALVIVTSDHGEAFFEHGRPGHRHLLHDEVLRVPLLVVPPRTVRAGLRAVSPVPAALADITATVLDFAGFPVPESIRGQSLRPSVYGIEDPFPPRMFSHYRSETSADGSRLHHQVYGLRSPEWKLLRRSTLSNGKVRRNVVKYWDLTRDPFEQAAIRDPNHPRLKEALAMLEARLADVETHWRRYPRTPDEQRSIDFDGWLSELKMLGYVIDDAPSGIDVAAPAFRPWGLGPLRLVDQPITNPTPESRDAAVPGPHGSNPSNPTIKEARP